MSSILLEVFLDCRSFTAALALSLLSRSYACQPNAESTEKTLPYLNHVDVNFLKLGIG
jgi:hypothetical protein